MKYWTKRKSGLVPYCEENYFYTQCWCLGHRCVSITDEPEECPPGYHSSSLGLSYCTPVNSFLDF